MVSEKMKKDFPFIKCNMDCGEGWSDLIQELSSELKTLGFDGEVVQIKEKFGGLRYYVSFPVESKVDKNKVRDIITQYEKKSLKTCEICGAKGELLISSVRWYRTRCTECDSKKEIF